jgi:hypothetical protein
LWQQGFPSISRDIAEQGEHHRKRTYSDEVKLLVERYGLKCRDDKTVETVSEVPVAPTPR